MNIRIYTLTPDKVPPVASHAPVTASIPPPRRPSLLLLCQIAQNAPCDTRSNTPTSCHMFLARTCSWFNSVTTFGRSFRYSVNSRVSAVNSSVSDPAPAEHVSVASLATFRQRLFSPSAKVPLLAASPGWRLTDPYRKFTLG